MREGFATTALRGDYMDFFFSSSTQVFTYDPLLIRSIKIDTCRSLFGFFKTDMMWQKAFLL